MSRGASGFFLWYETPYPPSLFLEDTRRKRPIFRISNLDLTFGLGDSAATAEVAGYLWSFVPILNSFPPVSISLTPNVQEFEFDGELGMKARIRALFLVVGFLKAYMKKPFRLLIKEVRARRKKQVKNGS